MRLSNTGYWDIKKPPKTKWKDPLKLSDAEEFGEETIKPRKLPKERSGDTKVVKLITDGTKWEDGEYTYKHHYYTYNRVYFNKIDMAKKLGIPIQSFVFIVSRYKKFRFKGQLIEVLDKNPDRPFDYYVDGVEKESAEVLKLLGIRAMAHLFKGSDCVKTKGYVVKRVKVKK